MTTARPGHDAGDRVRGALVVALVAHVIVRFVGAVGVIAAVLRGTDLAAPSWDGGLLLDALSWLTADLATAVCVSALAIVVAALAVVVWVLSPPLAL